LNNVERSKKKKERNVINENREKESSVYINVCMHAFMSNHLENVVEDTYGDERCSYFEWQ